MWSIELRILSRKITIDMYILMMICFSMMNTLGFHVDKGCPDIPEANRSTVVSSETHTIFWLLQLT